MRARATGRRRAPAARALALLGAGCVAAGCSGGGGGESAAPSFAYERPRAVYRVAEPIAPNAPAAGDATPSDLAVTPPLPAGLVLDTATGAVTGTPTAEAGWSAHVVSGEVDGAPVETTLELRVGPALPSAVAWLAEGYAVEVVAEGLSTPVKLAVAPDGRLFFNELASGDVQVIDPAGGFLPAPFASVTVESGDHRGLLGLALAPDFGTSGHVYVLATVPADGDGPARARVVRYTDSGGVGVDATVVVDDLPTADLDNGGELLFDATGNLLVSVGDVQDPAAAQDPTALAGKLLRYTAEGGIPADNPDPASPVWCLGLRNTFALALHPQTGGLYGADNGPDSDDELNWLAPERNYGWGYEGEGLGAEAGYTIRRWEEVIVPTAIWLHSGAGGWSAHAGELFLASYTDEDVRRIVLLGEQATDFHQELSFLRFAPMGQSAKPLDLCEAPDGALYVSTFSGIYRVVSLWE